MEKKKGFGEISIDYFVLVFILHWLGKECD